MILRQSPEILRRPQRMDRSDLSVPLARIQEPPLQRFTYLHNLAVGIPVVAVLRAQRVNEFRVDTDAAGIQDIHHHTHVRQQVRVEMREIT